MKKGVVTDFLPYLILGLVGIIVISAALIIPGLIAAKETGEAGICGLDNLIRGLGIKSTFGTIKAQDIPSACRAKNIFIDEKMVKQHLDEAEEAIKKYKEDPQKYKEVLQFFDEDESGYWEWALDKIIADELFDCWALKAVFGAVDTSEYLMSDTDCLLCAMIKFSDELRNRIKPKKYFVKGSPYIGSLGPFMRVEEKGYKLKKKQSVMTYDKWINNNYQFYPLRELPYTLYRTDLKGKPAPWAIVYAMDSENFINIKILPGITFQKTWMSFTPAKNFRKELYWFGSTIGEHEVCEYVFGE